ncbi:hypothetical protein [Micromonospora chersina]|uniref:hypothetical protein n=1 Tax=Micromonospora chersina TaxID=47854 RepID=UPI003D8D9D0A
MRLEEGARARAVCAASEASEMAGGREKFSLRAGVEPNHSSGVHNNMTVFEKRVAIEQAGGHDVVGIQTLTPRGVGPPLHMCRRYEAYWLFSST